LDGWQKQSDQYADDRDDDQELHQGESTPTWLGGFSGMTVQNAIHKRVTLALKP
jgi:hypothetical protein